MSKSLLIHGTPPQTGWAEVHARGQVVRYRRWGTGRPVLLLDSRADSDPAKPRLLKALSSEFRVIVPGAPESDADLDAWLSALLDGLGLPKLTVIASQEFCMPALHRALLDPDHVSAIVLICAGRGTDFLMSGSVATTRQLPAVPLLLLHDGQDTDEMWPVLLRFLNMEGVAPDA